MPFKISLVKNQTASECFWNRYDNNPYNDEKISLIKDNIGVIEVPITSIPSPFARLHLFEAAFSSIVEQYNKTKNQVILNGTTTYHRLISECLDVFEILFSFDELQLVNKVEIRSWDISKVKSLMEDSKTGRRIFADVLNLYINNYNKDKRFTDAGLSNPFNLITVLLLDNKVFAGTSPFTGFFTTPNNFEPVIKDQHLNRKFFETMVPLYKRNIEFQKFINLFFETQPAITQAFPELYKYIVINREYINDAPTRSYINEISTGKHREELNNYDILYIKESALNILPGIQYRYKKIAVSDIKKDIKSSCDYLIQSSKQLSEPPLALKAGIENPHWRYVRENPLDKSITIPAVDNRDYSERTLPGYDEVNYPFVIKNDFLSKYLMELSYDINDNKFWAGNSDSNVKNVLLPVNPEYFKFFTIEDLQKNLTINRLKSGAVHVILNIPIKADKGRASIKFERTYNEINPNNLEGEEKGVIIKTDFFMGIYPFYKLKDLTYNDLYKIALFSDSEIKVDCTFYRENFAGLELTTVPITDSFVRTREAESPFVSKYIELSKDLNEIEKDLRFDFINMECFVQDTHVNGLIIPLMDEIKTLSQTSTSIAYDVGTSNTYVSISANGSIEKLSNYQVNQREDKMQMVMFQKPITNVDEYKGSDQYDLTSYHGVIAKNLQLNEFMPSLIGGNSQYNFPIRTILNQDNDCNATNESTINVLSSVNIPFAFGLEGMREPYDNAYSGLKWGVSNSQDSAAKNRLKAFVEQLVIMGRNVIISKGLDPSNTDIMWFKPLSMATGQATIFNNIWEEYFVKYFSKQLGNTKKLHNITESWAPFYSYENPFGIGRYFLNIDIGGGTTDLLSFKDNNPSLTCSFRFAGDHLFDNGVNFNQADGQSGQSMNNGFVKKYERIMKKKFEDNQDDDKLKILDYIHNSNDLFSQDLIGFFFSIKDFSDMLKADKDFMLLFLLHNAAIFYHSAQILKARNPNDIPSYIGLSGNGARLLEIANKNKDLNRSWGMAYLASLIFQFVFELEQTPNIKLQILDNPKESTAVGGIKGLKQILQNPSADTENYYIPLGDKDTIIHFNDFETKKKYTYKSIRDESPIVQKIAENFKGFVSYFFERLWFEANLPNNFGVDRSYNTETLLEYFSNENNINDVLDSAINYKLMVEKELQLNETMFFIPLRAYLHAFSQVIAEQGELDKYKGS
jgi:hypothetical protein